MRRKEERHTLTHERIIDESYRLISEKGVEEFSMRALAKRLGSSPMTIYTYFSSKTEILAAVEKRLRDQYDNTPIPGEHWDDTVRRVAASIREHDLKDPEIYRLSAGWLDTRHDNAHRVYLLHSNQGMPPEVLSFIWCTIEAYLLGFVNQEIRLKEAHAGHPAEARDLPWLQVVEAGFNDESFYRGLNFIIDGIKRTYPEEQATWITPQNPAEWKWR